MRHLAMISRSRLHVLHFALRGNMKMVANSNLVPFDQGEVQARYRRGGQKRTYGSGKGIQNLISRNAVPRTPEGQSPRQEFTRVSQYVS